VRRWRKRLVFDGFRNGVVVSGGGVDGRWGFEVVRLSAGARTRFRFLLLLMLAFRAAAADDAPAAAKAQLPWKLGRAASRKPVAKSAAA
jgi:hypothetical protein